MDMLGEYIFVCLVFVVLALLEFAFIIILNRNADAKTTYENKEINLLKIENDSRLRKHDVAIIDFPKELTKESYLSYGNQERTKTKKGGSKRMSSIHSIHIIDLTASFVFPLAFLVYNCIYWIRNSDNDKIDD